MTGLVVEDDQEILALSTFLRAARLTAETGNSMLFAAWIAVEERDPAENSLSPFSVVYPFVQPPVPLSDVLLLRF